MYKISIPITEVVSYLEFTIDQWPWGHRVVDEKRARVDQITQAAAAFTTAYIRLSLRHLRSSADPLEALINALGYPLATMSEEETDELCAEWDDHYLAMTTSLDPMINHLVKMVGRCEIFIAHTAYTEDVVVSIGEDIYQQRYRRLKRSMSRLQPPKKLSTGADDLDGYDMYIENTLREAFKDIDDPHVRAEVKRRFLQALVSK